MSRDIVVIVELVVDRIAAVVGNLLVSQQCLFEVIVDVADLTAEAVRVGISRAFDHQRPRASRQRWVGERGG